MAFTWPKNHEMAVCLTWDVDGESAQYFRFPDRARNQLSELHQRLFGPQVGVWRVLRMLDDVAASGDADAYVQALLGRGERIMGFGHRVYRAEDPRARVLRRTAQELGSPRVDRDRTTRHGDTTEKSSSEDLPVLASYTTT